MTTNTKQRDRRNMAQDIPVNVGDNGAVAAPVRSYNHSCMQSHHSLISYIYVYYYLPTKNYNVLSLVSEHYMLIVYMLNVYYLDVLIFRRCTKITI